MNIERAPTIGLTSAVLAPMLFLGGCSVEQEKTPPYIVDNALAEQTLQTVNEFQPQPAACDIDGPDPMNAANCIELYDGASIALVNYSSPDIDPEALATKIEKHFTNITNGLARVAITVITPSNEARNLFEVQNPRCVDSLDITHYGSYIADAVTPSQFEQFDHIIAISEKPACAVESANGNAQSIGGVADPAYDRYVELFQVLPPITSPFGTFEQSPNSDSAATHELLHLYDLGHAGAISSNSPSLESYSDQPRVIATPITIDVYEYLNGASYNEYGDPCNAMGSSCTGFESEKKDWELNAIQLNYLNAPLYEQGVLSDTKERRLQSGSSTLFDSSHEPGSFATMTLPNPITLSGDISVFAASQDINSIAFVPHVEPIAAFHTGELPIEAFDIYLYNNIGKITTINVGMLQKNPDMQSDTYSLVLGDQIVEVVFDANGALITVK